MASERNVIDLARAELVALDRVMDGYPPDTAMLSVPIGYYRVLLASLIAHHEALGPMAQYGELTSGRLPSELVVGVLSGDGERLTTSAGIPASIGRSTSSTPSKRGAEAKFGFSLTAINGGK